MHFCHWDLDGRSPFRSFGHRWVGISRRITCICKSRKSQPIKFSQREVKLKSSHFKIIQNLKVLDCPLVEETQPVAVREIRSNARKHHNYTFFWYFRLGLSNFQKKVEKNLNIEPSCTKTKLLIELLLWRKPTLINKTKHTKL